MCCVRVWRIKQKAHDKHCIKRSVKLVASVMKGPCMNEDGPGRLFIVKERINSEAISRHSGIFHNTIVGRSLR